MRDVVAGLRAGEVAEAAAVNVETLRYYENRGLISPPPRDAAGHRRYPPHTPTLLRLIKGAQQMGFSLEEIRALIEEPPADGDISEVIARKLPEIDARIAELIRIREGLAAALPADRPAVSPGSPPAIGGDRRGAEDGCM